jgi:hypothetical protein
MEDMVVSPQPNINQLSFVPRTRPPGYLPNWPFRGINLRKALEGLTAMLTNLPDGQFFSLIFGPSEFQALLPFVNSSEPVSQLKAFFPW